MEQRTKGPAALIATLGTQPEVVTIALDLLLGDGVDVVEVAVVHTSDSPGQQRTPDRPSVDAARKALEAEFAENKLYRPRNRACELRFVPLEVADKPIDDIHSEEDARAVFNAIFDEVKRQKKLNRTVHLSIAGGRKSMSVYGMAVAQLLFDRRDQLWHVLSSPEFEATSLMHPRTKADAHLVRIPLFAISAVYPAVATLLTSDDPLRDLERKLNQADRQARENGQKFLERLTPLQRRLVDRLMLSIVRDNRSLSNKELARAEGIGPSVTGRYLTDIYGRLKQFLGLPEIEIVDRELLVYFLTPYYLEQV